MRKVGKTVYEKVCIVGHLGFGENLLNGQTIKMKNVMRELEKQYGEEQVIKIDTHGGIKALPKIIIQMTKAFKSSENVVIFPAHNGVKIFVPLCNVLNTIFKRKLHYIVIGGWAPLFFFERKELFEKELMYFDGIYVETSTMKKALMQLGLNNVVILKNFKDINILSKEELQMVYEKPYKICTFSDV